MTRMLASVRDIAEADLALRLGSDILDLKDVTRGVMTAVDVAIAEAIVAKLAGGRETSAALGRPALRTLRAHGEGARVRGGEDR